MPQTEDQAYFDSYAGAEVHRLMLADRTRTESYRAAIEALVKPGMTVLDVGAGTGILSFFAARAGAQRVYAVDNSDILEVTRELVRVNGFEDQIVCIEGVAEDIDLPGGVDVIVSEWMGLFAVTEAMFESVIRVAERHLKPKGILIPGSIQLFITPIQEDQLYQDHSLGFWTESLYGFDYTPMVAAEIADLDSNSVEGHRASSLGPPRMVADIDCYRDPAEAYWFDSKVEFAIERGGRFHGFFGHFEALLAPGVMLSTSHEETMTHWRQQWFPVRERELEAGDRIRLSFKARKDPTGMDPRKPTFFMEGEILRADEVIDTFFYCHHGTYE